jgi:hypothetical protein
MAELHRSQTSNRQRVPESNTAFDGAQATLILLKPKMAELVEAKLSKKEMIRKTAYNRAPY